MITVLARLADPSNLPVQWHPDGPCSVQWGVMLPDVSDHVVVGVEPFAGDVYAVHAPDKDTLTVLLEKAAWVKGVLDAYDSALDDGWEWPQHEYRDDKDEVIALVDKDVPTIAGGHSLALFEKVERGSL